MKLEAIKRQGAQRDLTCDQPEHKLDGKKSVQIFAEQAGESKTQVQRYIRLTELSPPLHQMVDEKKIALTPAVELSYLKPAEQKKPERSDITLSGDILRKYFPRSYTPRQMENTVIKLLEAWQRKRQRSQER